MHGAVFSRQLAIDARLVVGTESESSILQFGNIGEVIPIDIHDPSRGMLTEDHRSSTAVFADQRTIERGGRHQRSVCPLVLLEGSIALAKASGIAQRLSRDHIDHPTDGISTEEG